VSKAEINKVKPAHQRGHIANILIVDNDPELARFMLEISARKGIRANLAKDKKAAIAFLDRDDYDLVFIGTETNQNSDVPIRSQDGFELLRRIRANSPELPVIMISQALGPEEQNQQRTVETAVKSIRAGFCDFLIKPLNSEKIEILLDTLLPNHNVSTQASADDPCRAGRDLYRIVGRSAKLSQAIDLAKRIAPTSAPVLISGESGTGKELFSALVHHNSKRVQGPYIKINCAALSDSLLESELFGHEKGAFTGAYTQRRGRFEMAHGGTLLLDEVTETPPKFQAKLLRAIEQQDFERVGGEKQVRVNVRIISTTNKDLIQEVQQDRFRQDLYYRLSAVRLVISSLKQRTEDLPDLVWHFVNLHARETQRHITELDPAMMDIFTKYHWPGNVRQLRNVVLTSMILGVGETLSLADVSWLFDELQPLPEIAESRQQTTGSNITEFIGQEKPNSNSGLGGVPLEQIERLAILDTLRQTDGNQMKAAKVLGISDRTLRERIRRYRQQGCVLNKV
jgi:DNA-binding NtrC family response regulator